jgi:23S rRNA (cytosine1962-C5)-methyltransferase
VRPDTARSLPRIRLDKRTAAAVGARHPWVWQDVLESQPRSLAAGDEVVLLDAVGGFLARGLAEGPGGGLGIRVFSWDEREPSLRKLLFRRVAAARRLRERVVAPDTTAFRLLHGEGDDLPGLVVDRYGPVLVVRPDSAAWDRHLRDAVEALRSEGGAGIKTILLRPKRGEARLLYGADVPEQLVVQEEGRRYLVRPGLGQKTGFFCDQRPNRTAAQALARPGDRALNLFSYTGGFSVAMALGGADRVLSVDVSEPILADCRHQFGLNGLDTEAHAFEARDIFEWLPRFARSADRPTFDLAVCDPPSLSHGKAELPRARAAYRRLHQGLAGLLGRGALLITCSCTSRLTADDLLADARAGLEQGGRRISRVLAVSGAGPDHPVPPSFPEGRYLACLTLVID